MFARYVIDVDIYKQGVFINKLSDYHSTMSL